MTTENDGTIELPNREISVLLEMDSFQDMTDSEIQSLIDWHVSVARMEAVASEDRATYDRTMAQLIEDNQTHNATMEAMLQSIRKRSTNLTLGVIS